MAHLNITFSILIANVHINIKTAITRCVYILEYLRMKKKTNKLMRLKNKNKHHNLV